MRISSLASFLSLALLATACGSSSGGGGDDSGGDDDGNVDAGGSGTPDSSGGDPLPGCDELVATIRDFKIAHPDMEEADGNNDKVEKGLVKVDLGTDGKPQYARTGGAGGIHVESPESFAQWYRDVDNVNTKESFTFRLLPTGTGDAYEFSDDTFFPVDGEGFGNESGPGNENGAHNFHFTTEIHTTFVYKGGETFTFNGDDDLWLFVNGKLALDLGGLHPRVEDTVDMDAQKDALGLEVGQTYAMDIFHAERHTTASTFKVSTTIDCFIVVD
jgi:fibro-slime domain-containing protein